MGNKVGTGSLSLIDLNDAIIAGEAPLNPTEGTLWIDSSLTPPVLKKWSNGAWVKQAMDLTELDPEFTDYISRGVDAATTKLGNLSSDDRITATERQVILDKLTDMLGSSPSGTVALPAVATVNTYTVGEYYQTRKSATDAGVSTSDAAYTAYANAYTTLANYLNTITVDGIYCWDVSNAKAESVHTIVGQTFRDNWKAFYQAQLVLQTRTSKRVTDAKAEAEAYTKSYREQLVGNGFAGVGSNRNFSGFTYTTAQKVTGPGSFSRTATGETRTDEFIAIEPDRTYRLMISVINSTTTGTHNMGLECYNAAGTSLGKRHLIRNSSGTTVIPSTTSFVHYEAVISGLNVGTGSVTDTDFPAGTTQVKVWFNTNNSTTTNTIYIADVSFALETIEANKDYNGLTMSAAKGMVITSTKNISEFNSTDGIKIYKKTDVANPVFKLDANTGDLIVTGNINMTNGSISWANINKPTAAQVGAATPDDVSGAVKNIQIGGRNLLLNSYAQYKWNANNTGKGTSVLQTDETNPYYRVTAEWAGGVSLFLTLNNTSVLSEMPVSGQTYVLGIDLRATEDSLIVLYDSQSSTESRNSVTIPANKWTRVYTNAYVSPNGVTMVQPILTSNKQVIDMRNMKYEKGNKGTEWTPAPEDTTTAINTLEIGGTNLLFNSNFKNTYQSGSLTNKHPDLYAKEYTGYNPGVTNPTTSYHAHVDATTFGYNVIEFNESDGNRQWKAASTQVFPTTTGAYMVSMDLYQTLNGASVMGGFYYRKKGETTYSFASGQYTVTPSGVNAWKRYSAKVMLNDDVDFAQPISFYFYGYNFTSNSILYMKNVQLEKGDKATDWSPAPRDSVVEIDAIRTAAQATGLLTVIDSTSIQTGKIKADFMDVKGLTVNNGSKNTFRVDSAGNVSVDGNINMTGGTISWANITPPSAAQVGAATISDVNGAINNIQIGGTNLLQNSTFNLGNWGISPSYGAVISPDADKPSSNIFKMDYLSSTAIGTPVYANTRFYLNPKVGDTLTFSLDFYCDNYATNGPKGNITTLRRFDNPTGGAYVQSVSSLNRSDYGISETNGVWQRGTSTFTFSAGNAVAGWYCFGMYLQNQANVRLTFKMRELQVEYGNKATAWTPAPEDINAQVKTVDGKVENIQVGARNIFKESSFKNKKDGETVVMSAWGGNVATGTFVKDTPSNLTGNSFLITVTTEGTGGSYWDTDNFEIEAGKTYTVSYYAKAGTAGTTNGYICSLNRLSDNNYIMGQSIALTTAWQRFSFTFTATAGQAGTYRRRHMVYQVNSYFIANVQLEEGNKMSGWSLNPDEVLQTISDVKVGTRNLLLDSGRLVSTSSYGMTSYPLTKTLAENTEVTLSLKGYLGVGKIYFGIYNSGGNVQLTSLTPADMGTDGVFRKTFNWKIGSSSNVNVTIYHMNSSTTATSTIEWIKLEEGNKSTDWSPAPEDASSKITDLYTLTNNVGGVTVIDANKIQTGTLDATKVNVTKLNASNITSGTINASVIGVTNINASNITTGAINANLITTGSMNAARITAGTITGDKIAANTIVANKLSVGATNLVNDPMVEAIGTVPFDATTVMVNNGWSKGSSVPTFVDDGTYGRVLKLTNNGGSNSTIFTNGFYVDSTKTYKITIRFKHTKTDGSAPTNNMYIGFNGFNTVTSPSSEIANKGSYEYISDSFSTSGTNPYFYIPNRGQAGLTSWSTLEVYLYPPEFYGDRTKLKTPTFPNTSASTQKAWYMDSKTNMVKLRFLNYNGSTSYGDGTTASDLYIGNVQVTEVDGGTLTATNIVTGTLNADLISIASATSGVTINSGGVTATNSSTGVSVKMNSSTGFEIKKGADTVFTVNSDGSLTAKDLTVSATYASSNANTSYGFTALQKDGLVIQESNVNSVTGYSLSYTTKYGNRGMDMLMDQPGIGQQRMLLTTSGMRFSGYGGYNVDGVLIGIDSQGPRIETTDALGVITLNSSNKISMSGSSGISMNTATNSGSYKIDFRTNIMSVDTVFGKVNMSSSPSVSSVREVTLDLDPADQTAAYEGLRMFSRKNGVGLYEKGGSYTFLKHTPSINSSKKLTELFGEDITIYSNYDYTLKSNGNGLIQSNNNLNFDVKNLLDIGVRNANNGLTSVLFADGTKDSGGVWVELGGGARTHVYAGEKVIVPNTDLGFGNTSESIVIEANSNFYAYWGTQSGFVDNQGVVGIGGSFRPAVSGKLTLGNDTYRWSTIYAVNSLNTSDSSTKTNIIQLNDTKVHNPRFSYSRWEEKDEISPEIIYQEMKQMPLFLFEYKDIEGSSPQVGFMADQLLQDDKTGVASRFVNKETEDSIASASTQSYAATLHVALQEEMKRNDVLEKKVEDLEARLLRLEQLLGGQS